MVKGYRDTARSPGGDIGNPSNSAASNGCRKVAEQEQSSVPRATLQLVLPQELLQSCVCCQQPLGPHLHPGDLTTPVQSREEEPRACQ